MKPVDFYQLKPVNVLKGAEAIDALRGFYFNHISEIIESIGWLTNNTKITVNINGYRNIDERRYWLVGAVLYDNMPVMIIQNAGREGDDHEKRFITDKENYLEMIDYIKSLMNLGIDDKIYFEDENIEDLVDFYGYSLT